MPSKLPEPALNTRASQLVDGLLLGDGCITQSGQRLKRLSVTQRADRVGWLTQIKSLLGAEGINSYITGPFAVAPGSINGLTVRSKPKVMLSTCNAQIFNTIHARWYVPNPTPKPHRKWLKIVPRDLALTSLVLAHWFAGDGSTNPLGQLSLHTQGFSPEDVAFLVQRLQEDLGLEASMYTVGTGSGPLITFTRTHESYRLAEIVAPLLPDCIQYKLAHIRAPKRAWRAFTDQQIREIRAAHAAGKAIRALAREHEISKSCISAIVRRTTYRHVE